MVFGISLFVGLADCPLVFRYWRDRPGYDTEIAAASIRAQEAPP
jgi:hypothetical protein